MAKLLPPIVQGRLPAQEHDTALSLAIPYKLNPAVGFREFDSIYLKIKSVSTGVDVGTPIQTTTFSGMDSKGNYIANFSISNKEPELLTKDSYYKAQIAFASGEEVGYYSSVGVFKCGDPGNAFITNLKVGSVSVMPVFLRGSYVNKSDITEKVQSYQFTIYDNNDKAIERSEELIEPYYEIKMRPSNGSFYTVALTVTTINGFIVKSASYKVTGIQMSELPVNIEAIPDFESGSIKVSATGEFNGTYQLETNGRPLLTKTFAGKSFEYIDRNCEQGERYIYTLYKIESSGQFSASISTVETIIDFEDVFLHDDKKSVCIRYNPKISSFKTMLLESKQEALGNKYPYFFRNGSVGYKEFTIGGLISRLTDFNEDSVARASTDANGDKEVEFTTNLSADNFRLERKYKLELLDWLNNGKIKMFRSSAEGNYCVRLMNVSLQPQETLGRMLHSFTCTAYEAADIDYFNKKEIISEKTIVENNGTNVILSSPLELDLPGAYSFTYKGQDGDILTVLYENGEEQTFVVGYTKIISAENIKNIIRFSSTNLESEISYLAYKYDTTETISTMIVEEYSCKDEENKISSIDEIQQIEIYVDQQSVVNGDRNFQFKFTIDNDYDIDFNLKTEINNEGNLVVFSSLFTKNNLYELNVTRIELVAGVRARVIRKVSVVDATTN